MLIKVKNTKDSGPPDRQRVAAGLSACAQMFRLAGKLSPQLEAAVIAQARYYAKRNKLPFDGSLNGALKLIEEADRTVRGYIELAAASQPEYDGRNIKVTESRRI